MKGISILSRFGINVKAIRDAFKQHQACKNKERVLMDNTGLHEAVIQEIEYRESRNRDLMDEIASLQKKMDGNIAVINQLKGLPVEVVTEETKLAE